MAKYRRDRINDAMAQELAVILRDVKDARVNEAMVSVTHVDVTADLKFAKVYYSHMLGDTRDVQKGLESAAGYIRHRVAEGMNLRITPEFSFKYDGSIEHGTHIAKLLHDIAENRTANSRGGEEQAEKPESTEAGEN